MIIDLERIGEPESRLTGPKAYSLSRMVQAGLTVPDGFCITREANTRHLQANELLPVIARKTNDAAGADREAKQAVLAELRQAIIDAPLFGQAQVAITTSCEMLQAGSGGNDGEFAVAVRSSATAEDLPGRSFAGQHDTFLDVRGVDACLGAVKRCWASLWTERAFDYRQHSGVGHAGIEMAVIVQRMVKSESSGVCFTADPLTGREDRLVIESVRGLGESLVSGKATPDRFTLSRPELAIINRELVGDAGGKPAIDTDETKEIAGLALLAEELFGHPLDIEWAIENGKIYLLQARPITAIPQQASRTARHVWSNTNTGEVIPGVVTPFTWSVVEPMVDMLIGDFLKSCGIDLQGNPITGRIAGRVYFNLSTLAAATQKIPGRGSKSLAELFGGGPETTAAIERMQLTEADLPDFSRGRLKRLLMLPWILYRVLTYTAARGQATIDRIISDTEKLHLVDVASLSDEDLAKRLRQEFRTILSMASTSEVLCMATGFQTLFYSKCAEWFGEEGNAIASKLLACTERNDNAKMGLALWKLAAAARELPVVRDILREGNSWEETYRRLEQLEGGADFLAAWDNFMREYGHHGRAELEFANPRWIEQPGLILDQLRSYLESPADHDFDDRYRHSAQLQEQTVAECLRRLTGPLQRMSFRWILHKARTCGPLRDSMRAQTIKRLTQVRLLLLELGERLAALGVFDQRDDVFMLKHDELSLAFQPAAHPEIRQRIAGRRAEYENNTLLNPPPVIVGEFDPTESLPDKTAVLTGRLTGVAVNPGVVTGKAKVILATGKGRVEPGEILVAPYTDPGWTPLFLNAAAIVTDSGGVLSHGSIIAREYGIPAVANVGKATQLIKPGQLIEVDGALGTVTILD